MRFGIIHESPEISSVFPFQWGDYTEIVEKDVIDLIKYCLEKRIRVIFDFSKKPDYGFVTIVCQ